MKEMLLLLVVTLVVIESVYANTHALDLDQKWLNFQDKYDRNYADRNEEIRRRLIWEENLKYIDIHNAEFEKGIHTYTVGMNQFGDMSNAEFVTVMTGILSHKREFTVQKSINVTSLPDSVDWKKKGFVGPVGNQGRCGSCWAFTATGAMEGQHAKKTGTLVTLSNQELMDCSTKQGNHGCEGGMMDFAFQYEGKCRFKRADVGATVTGFVDLKSGTESELQEAVANIGPIAVAIDATRSSFQFYKNGVYNEPKCDKKQINHSLLVTGYGTLNGQEYWATKNSWGTDWGMGGYVLLARNKDNQCGIATMPSYPTV